MNNLHKQWKWALLCNAMRKKIKTWLWKPLSLREMRKWQHYICILWSQTPTFPHLFPVWHFKICLSLWLLLIQHQKTNVIYQRLNFYKKMAESSCFNWCYWLWKSYWNKFESISTVLLWTNCRGKCSPLSRIFHPNLPRTVSWLTLPYSVYICIQFKHYLPV